MVQIEKPVYYYMQNMQSSPQVRYKESAIRSICIANKTRKDIISKYPELKEDLYKCITKSLCSLYANGYDNDARLGYYIKKYDMASYMTVSNIIMNCTFTNLVRLIFRFVFKR